MRRHYYPHALAAKIAVDTTLPAWDVEIRGYTLTRTRARRPVEPRTHRIHARSAEEAEAVAVALTMILDGSRQGRARPAAA